MGKKKVEIEAGSDLEKKLMSNQKIFKEIALQREEMKRYGKLIDEKKTQIKTLTADLQEEIKDLKEKRNMAEGVFWCCIEEAVNESQMPLLAAMENSEATTLKPQNFGSTPITQDNPRYEALQKVSS